MGIAEIIILLTGAILFTVSFFVPDRSNSSVEGLDEEEEKRIIRELLDEEMDKVRFQIEEATEDVINENRDKMERAMDRITNEKMNAVNEYSDTVIEQIHKNHEEAVFLYDMLNNKHSQVKNTAAELNQLTKSAKVANAKAVEAETKESVEKTVATPVITSRVESVPTPMMTTMPGQGTEEKSFEKLELDKIEEPAVLPEVVTTSEPVISEPVVVENEEEPKVDEPKVTAKKAKKPKAEKKPVADAGLDLMFATDSNSANNNDRILELHKAGKSNMAIAKELGLGIGEVKLVIDLFEGI